MLEKTAVSIFHRCVEFEVAQNKTLPIGEKQLGNGFDGQSKGALVFLFFSVPRVSLQSSVKAGPGSVCSVLAPSALSTLGRGSVCGKASRVEAVKVITGSPLQEGIGAGH